jgi:hypothetical protein
VRISDERENHLLVHIGTTSEEEPKAQSIGIVTLSSSCLNLPFGTQSVLCSIADYFLCKQAQTSPLQKINFKLFKKQEL